MRKEPILKFKEWLTDWLNSDTCSDEPNAVVLSTISQGFPAARVVLLKDVSCHSFVFYTNYSSDKGEDLKRVPVACMTFVWIMDKVVRQVRVTGVVSRLSNEQNDVYWDSRTRFRQAAAVCSPQSQVIKSKKVIQKTFLKTFFSFNKPKFDKNNLRVDMLKEIKRPPNWGGYTLNPTKIEFWESGHSALNIRMHDRTLYVRATVNDDWKTHILAP